MAAIAGLLLLLVSFALVGGLIFLTVWWSNAINKRRQDAWSRAARSLGLHFDGSSIYGTLNGHPVRAYILMRAAGRNQQAYTLVSSSFTIPLDLGLNLTRQGFFNDTFGSLFGSQDIQLGDAQFDPAVIIKGDEEDRVRAALTGELRQLVLPIATNTPFALNDVGVTIDRMGTIDSEAWMSWALQAVARVAGSVDRVRTRIPAAAQLRPHLSTWQRFAHEQGLTSSETPMAMWGELEGRSVFAYAVRTGAQSFALEVRVDLSRALSDHLRVRSATTVDSLSNFFGMRSNTVGDPVFDKIYVVDASDRERIPVLLDADVRRMLIDLAQRVGPVTITDQALAIRTPWMSRRPADAIWLINQVRELSDRIVRNAGVRADKVVTPYR